MFRTTVRRSLAFLLLTASTLAAQTGQGSLRGYVKDESGGALPGAEESKWFRSERLQGWLFNLKEMSKDLTAGSAVNP